ncbi:cupin domain-containing protein [Hyphomicrobium sp.]|uniref:cupin domain-containing protein n=1 Tax=Hyphomicrobium sp. TaxID=82 RepID=UPI002D784B93|nr:cupin domain-containing protein [Hyphomicrobium sp.]HET6389212.1 cupin domain-containing protein [Hyphomicrobium sp.]
MAAKGQRSNSQPIQLGQRLKTARKAKGLLLREVADQVGCSKSLLSKFEHGAASPSLSTLHRIVQVLGINIGALCDHVPASIVHVSKANSRPVITTAANGSDVGVVLERLVPHGAGHQLQGNIHIVPPGHGSVGSITHEGEEIGYILAGRLDLTIGKDTFRLKEGDSFVFSSGIDHSYRNPGRKTAKIIWINTPPTF